MSRNSTNTLSGLLLLVVGLSGCATSKDKLLAHDGTTMVDIWNQQSSGQRGAQANRELLDARQALRRPLIEPERSAAIATNATYSRTARTEIYRQFQRVPNPDLVMYVFPHLAGSERVPVPGYSTVFPMHSRIEYALPGERTGDY